MRKVLVVLFLVVAISASAQSPEQRLATTMQRFHGALIMGDTLQIKKMTHPEMSYGHSNGWIESQADMISHITTGYMKYKSIKEDSISAVLEKNIAYIRFVADIGAVLKGNAATYHLKVLEVWIRPNKEWVLFARQAVK